MRSPLPFSWRGFIDGAVIVGGWNFQVAEHSIADDPLGQVARIALGGVIAAVAAGLTITCIDGAPGGTPPEE